MYCHTILLTLHMHQRFFIVFITIVYVRIKKGSKNAANTFSWLLFKIVCYTLKCVSLRIIIIEMHMQKTLELHSARTHTHMHKSCTTTIPFCICLLVRLNSCFLIPFSCICCYCTIFSVFRCVNGLMVYAWSVTELLTGNSSNNKITICLFVNGTNYFCNVIFGQWLLYILGRGSSFFSLVFIRKFDMDDALHCMVCAMGLEWNAFWCPHFMQNKSNKV